jgi:hypothetical protein
MRGVQNYDAFKWFMGNARKPQTGTFAAVNIPGMWHQQTKCALGRNRWCRILYPGLQQLRDLIAKTGVKGSACTVLRIIAEPPLHPSIANECLLTFELL